MHSLTFPKSHFQAHHREVLLKQQATMWLQHFHSLLVPKANKSLRECAHICGILYICGREIRRMIFFCFFFCFFLVNEWTILMDCFICMPGFLTPSVGNKSQSPCRQIYSDAFQFCPFCQFLTQHKRTGAL